ncbi:MAG: hypothetical protein M0R03_16790 [Novosphingobium sp.]|nr:hypothetical protein [Novosphingobium sp.]
MTKDQAIFLIKIITDSGYKPLYEEQKLFDSITLMDWDLSWKQEKWLKSIRDKSLKNSAHLTN